MIRGYFRAQNPDMAESLLDRYLRSSQDASGTSNGKMDQRLVGTMVEGFGLLGDGDKLDGFLDRQDVEITTVGTMATVIQSRLYHGDALGAERDLKHGLDQFGVVALQSSIQGVLSGLALNGSVSSCESLANLLSTNGLMDAGAYAALLVCYGRSGDATKLKHVYDELLQKGLPLEQGLANKVKFEWLKPPCI
jgi:pentatricopeptide repeat protein